MTFYRLELVQGTKSRRNITLEAQHPGQAVRIGTTGLEKYGIQSEFLTAHIINDAGFGWRYSLVKKNGKYEYRMSKKLYLPLNSTQIHEVFSGATAPHEVV